MIPVFCARASECQLLMQHITLPRKFENHARKDGLKKLVFFGEVFKSFKHKGLKSFSTMEVVSNLINTYLTDIFFM